MPTTSTPLVFARAHVELPGGVSYERVRAVFDGQTFRAFDIYGQVLYEADATVLASSRSSWTMAVEGGEVLVEKAGCGCSGGRR